MPETAEDATRYPAEYNVPYQLASVHIHTKSIDHLRRVKTLLEYAIKESADKRYVEFCKAELYKILNSGLLDMRIVQKLDIKEGASIGELLLEINRVLKELEQDNVEATEEIKRLPSGKPLKLLASSDPKLKALVKTDMPNFLAKVREYLLNLRTSPVLPQIKEFKLLMEPSKFTIEPVQQLIRFLSDSWLYKEKKDFKTKLNEIKIYIDNIKEHGDTHRPSDKETADLRNLCVELIAIAEAYDEDIEKRRQEILALKETLNLRFVDVLNTTAAEDPRDYSSSIQTVINTLDKEYDYYSRLAGISGHLKDAEIADKIVAKKIDELITVVKGVKQVIRNRQDFDKIFKQEIEELKLVETKRMSLLDDAKKSLKQLSTYVNTLANMQSDITEFDTHKEAKDKLKDFTNASQEFQTKLTAELEKLMKKCKDIDDASKEFNEKYEDLRKLANGFIKTIMGLYSVHFPVVAEEQQQMAA